MPYLQQNTFGTIKVGALIGFEYLVGELKGDVFQIYQKLNFNPAVLNDADHEVPLGTYSGLLEEAAIETQIREFGLIFGSRFDPHDFGVLGCLMETSHTIGDGIANFGTYFPILQSTSEISVQISGDIARISYQVLGGTLEERAQDAEFSIAVLNGFCKRTIPDSWMCKRVEFEHHTPGDNDLCTQIFGCRVHYGCQTNAIYCDAEFIKSAVPRHNSHLYDLLLDHARTVLGTSVNSQTLLTQLQDWQQISLRNQTPTNISDAANAFAFSIRSLQRRLNDMGTNYRTIQLDATMTEATRLLEVENLPVHLVSEYLGYSETSAFSRSFKRHQGQTPTTLKKHQK